MNSKSSIIAAAVFGVCVIAGTFIVANTFYQVKGAENAISVTGSSQQVITSDVVKWQSSFSRSATTDNLTNGYAQMKKDLAIVMQYLGDNGIATSTITIDPITVMANYDNSGGYSGKGGGSTIIGYSLTQDVTVDSNDVEGVTKVAQNSGAIINQGVVFSSQPLQYFYSKLSELKLDMLSDATKDAQARAGRIAASAGAGLGKLQSASMGVFQITPINSTDLSDYGYYDTTSIQKQITAIVRTSFSVK